MANADQRQSPTPQEADQKAPVAQPETGLLGQADALFTKYDPLAADVSVGVSKALLNTKDFFFGKPSAQDESTFRASVDATAKQLSAMSPVNNFAIGVTQFATGMLGLGKVTAALKVVPLVAKAAGAIENAGPVAQAVAGEVKAATVGAVAFDPHDARLSNLIQSIPALQNPVTQFLAASPDDSTSMGRLKSALESLGLAATLGPLFSGSLALFRATKAGDPAAVDAAKANVTAALKPTMEQVKGTIEAGGEAGAGPAGVPPPPDVEPVAGVADHVLAEGKAAPQVASAVGSPQLTNETAAVGQDVESVEAQPSVAVASADQGPRGVLDEISDGQVKNLLSTMRNDDVVVSEAGSWQAALNAGHTFKDAGTIPWQKLGSMPDQQMAFINRVADEIEDNTNAAKGGAVMSDAEVQAKAGRMAELLGEDPSSVMGWLQQTADAAPRQAADMEAAYLITKKGFGDLYTMASKYNAGILDEWGGNPVVAAEALRRSLSAVSTAYNAAQAIKSNAGRTLRRMQFQVDPASLTKLGNMNPDEMALAIAGTKGDPSVMGKLMQPSWWERFTDWANFLQSNNLLWGWKTHVVNFVSNSFNGLVRPAERAVGSFFVPNGSAIRSAAMKQYSYMGSAIGDAFIGAKNAFLAGDGQLIPHGGSEIWRAGEVGSDNDLRSLANANEWEPWGTLSGLVTNTFTGIKAGLSLPARSVGGADEFWKQITYRSTVMANADVEGRAQGLAGPDLVNYVKQRLNDSLDDNGVAIDPQARQEALTSTFQQNLLPHTVGSAVQYAAANVPGVRVILPFVRTPANLMRAGWQMTPGLNMLQGEYRRMITGQMGNVAQAQAVGQMGMGSLFMGLAAYLWSQGRIVGGGPTDPKQRSELMAKGFQPYSFTLPNSDGSTTYVPFGKFDPIAMPLGIMADLAGAMDVYQRAGDQDGQTRVEAAGLAVLVSTMKQMGDKSYLTNLSNFIDAMNQPQEQGQHFVNKTVENFVPADTLLRNVNPDPYMRDARKVTDAIMSQLPGYSQEVPAKYNALGEPIRVRSGITSDIGGDPVDTEFTRMVLDGATPEFLPPSPNVGNGVDLRDLTMKDGSNAYEKYQQLAGHIDPNGPTMRDQLREVITSPGYQQLVDGPVTIPGTKPYALAKIIAPERAAALREVKADPNVSSAVLKARLQVAGAVAAKQADPTGAKTQGAALAKIGQSFGLDLSGLPGGRQ